MMNPLNTSAIALWHTLMSVNNMHGWTEWFTVSNTTLQQLTNLSKQGLVDARKELEKAGLIQYQSGGLRGPGSYKMISLVNRLVNSLDQSKQIVNSVDHSTSTMVNSVDQRPSLVNSLDHMVNSPDHIVNSLDHMVNSPDHIVNSLDQSVDQKGGMVKQMVNLLDQSLDHIKTETETFIYLNNIPPLNNISPPKKKRDKEKKKYRDYVSMTEDEYQKLLDTYGEEFTERCLDVLNAYKGSKGKTYKSDYLAILNWVVGRVEEEMERKQAKEGRHEKYQGDSSRRIVVDYDYDSLSI